MVIFACFTVLFICWDWGFRFCFRYLDLDLVFDLFCYFLLLFLIGLFLTVLFTPLLLLLLPYFCLFLLRFLEVLTFDLLFEVNFLLEFFFLIFLTFDPLFVLNYDFFLCSVIKCLRFLGRAGMLCDFIISGVGFF